MDPETIVAEVAQKTTWKNQLSISPEFCIMKSLKPMNFPASTPILPYIRPHPMKKNTTDPMQKSSTFFIRMLFAFFARQSPHSTIANPGCMKNTSAPHTRSQMAVRLWLKVSFSSFCDTVVPSSFDSAMIFSAGRLLTSGGACVAGVASTVSVAAGGVAGTASSANADVADSAVQTIRVRPNMILFTMTLLDEFH